ncbi:MAG: TAXI family TRAP transporter solute-binding subunit [Alphaproteobacteria bacterium]|nr:TAXI family TRAP transporter solute-binding subunit [Alphaproteobacteria bacterium]MDP6516888.1 TAXI family TRAP transporter solute-binding subunit [Alphaproteobacteria bacterium]
MKRRHVLMSAVSFAWALALAGFWAVPESRAADISLPRTIVWTAYNTGTSGYNQAVAIGGVLKTNYGVNLRVLPGKNDVSRLSPLRSGKAQFSATGSDSIYAQEAVYTFGTRKWGPQPIRLLLHNVADGCAVAMAVAGDAGVETLADLKGKQVAWVRGAPAINKAIEAMLAFAGLGWNDVRKAEVGGFGASIDGIITGDHDAAVSATFSTFMVKLEASPRGLYHPPAPHGDSAGWARLNAVVPWYFPHHCAQGAGVSEDGYEGIATAYPILISTPEVSAETAYNMTKAMYAHYEDYKDGAPGANGWAWERQGLETVFLPFHDGAIRYYTETGAWTPAAAANHGRNLARQETIQEAWATYVETAPEDADAFATGWMAARAGALRAAGETPLFESW